MTVLAATDLSGTAFLAVRQAAAIARALGARLEVLHVIDSFSTAWADAHLAPGSGAAVLTTPPEEALTAIDSSVRSEFGVPANGLVVEGKPAVEIAARSEAVDAEVIVLGARGVNRALAPLLGSTAHRVLARSRRPVLLVKQGPRYGVQDRERYRRIVVATDFSPDAEAAARSARTLFPEAAFTLLHAAASEPCAADAHRELESFAGRSCHPDAHRVVRHGPAARTICGYARESAADLIVLGSRRTSLLRRRADGTVGMDTIAAADCDVLLAPSPLPVLGHRS